jgi:hypothetical protein
MGKGYGREAERSAVGRKKRLIKNSNMIETMDHMTLERGAHL